MHAATGFCGANGSTEGLYLSVRAESLFIQAGCDPYLLLDQGVETAVKQSGKRAATAAAQIVAAFIVDATAAAQLRLFLAHIYCTSARGFPPSFDPLPSV